jgi:hypothetical protein
MKPVRDHRRRETTVLQRPASVVLCYVNDRRQAQADWSLCRALVHVNIIERSVVEVSFYCYSMFVRWFRPPHTVISSIKGSFTLVSLCHYDVVLTNVGKQAIELLRPIVVRLLSVISSQTLALDRKPPSRRWANKRPGKMQQGYFWPM